MAMRRDDSVSFLPSVFFLLSIGEYWSILQRGTYALQTERLFVINPSQLVESGPADMIGNPVSVLRIFQKLLSGNHCRSI